MPVRNLPFNSIQPAQLSPGDVAMCLHGAGGPPWRTVLAWALKALGAGEGVVCLSDEPLADRLALVEEAKPLVDHLATGRLVIRGSSEVLLRDGEFETGWALDQVRTFAERPVGEGGRVTLMLISMPVRPTWFPGWEREIPSPISQGKRRRPSPMNSLPRATRSRMFPANSGMPTAMPSGEPGSMAARSV